MENRILVSCTFSEQEKYLDVYGEIITKSFFEDNTLVSIRYPLLLEKTMKDYGGEFKQIDTSNEMINEDKTLLIRFALPVEHKFLIERELKVYDLIKPILGDAMIEVIHRFKDEKIAGYVCKYEKITPLMYAKEIQQSMKLE